ncbi:MAG: 4a-hydroxytetrahydrobiopterin dehydratase [SAR202 cluster bacterium]|nr:4a-hydroxytetrahydrobiopterin dehydratase [SAR202 cluster bacterium]
MTTLSQEKCVACRKDSPQVTAEETAQLLPLIPDWQLIEIDGVKRLSRAFKFKDFKTALAFTNAIGDAAEAEGHHPKLTTEWGRTSVEWWTHKIKGLHRNDFIMASKTDQIHEAFAAQQSAPSLT